MTISNRKGKKYYNNRVGPSNMRYIPIYVKDQKSVVPSEIGFFFLLFSSGLVAKGRKTRVTGHHVAFPLTRTRLVYHILVGG